MSSLSRDWTVQYPSVLLVFRCQFRHPAILCNPCNKKYYLIQRVNYLGPMITSNRLGISHGLRYSGICQWFNSAALAQIYVFNTTHKKIGEAHTFPRFWHLTEIGEHVTGVNIYVLHEVQIWELSDHNKKEGHAFDVILQFFMICIVSTGPDQRND